MQKIGGSRTQTSCCTDCCLQIALMLRKSKKISMIFVEQGQLFRRVFNQAPLRCLTVMRWQEFLKKVMQEYVTSTNWALGSSNRWIHLGYYWSYMEAYIASFTRRCQASQLNNNKIHARAIKLHSFNYTLVISDMGLWFDRSCQSTISRSQIKRSFN